MNLPEMISRHISPVMLRVMFGILLSRYASGVYLLNFLQRLKRVPCELGLHFAILDTTDDGTSADQKVLQSIWLGKSLLCCVGMRYLPSASNRQEPA
jgi:hypothetical protein